MADVFLSYAHSDRESAQRFARLIESHGWTVWWDPHIPAGKSYEKTIEQELERAACVVLLWTQNAAVSQWVQNEAGEGVRRGILIPVRLEDIRLPLSFRHLHADPLFGWSDAEIAACLHSITSMIGSPRQPPAVAPPSVPTPAAPARRIHLLMWISIVVPVILGLIFVMLQSFSKTPPDTGPKPVHPAVEITTTAATHAAAPTTTAPKTTTVLMTGSGGTMTTTRTIVPAPEVVDFLTDGGVFTVELFPDAAPEHVRNFLSVAHSGGFDGTTIDYIPRNGFAVGKRSWTMLKPESNELAPVRGSIRNLTRFHNEEEATRFFVLTGEPSPNPREQYFVFGRVVEGMNVVDHIASGPPHRFTITRATVRQR